MDSMEADRLPSIVTQSDTEPSGVIDNMYLSPLNSSWEQYLVGAGLANMGNTCFINAVLQCLTHTVPLVQKIYDAKHSCPNNDDAWDNFCSFCTLKEHIDQCLVTSGGVVFPHKLVCNLSKISSCLEPGQQEDAHEFLTSLLDSVHNSSLSRGAKDKPASLDEDSIVTEVFGGRLRSQLRCCDCGHCSDTYEPFLNLSLEIDNFDNIMDALKSFTKVEKIEDPEVKITCGGCNSQVSMEKQLKLDRAPQVAALHLKRFKNNGFFSSKICDPVKYPLELDLKPFLSCPVDEVDLKYDLYAVVMHLGSSYEGHYYCIVRSSPTTWHEMDDSQVSKYCESNLLEMDQAAYILFYVKQDSTYWFSSLMKAENIPNQETTDTSPISVLDHAERIGGLYSAGDSTCCSYIETPERPEYGGPSNMDCPSGSTTNDSFYEFESHNVQSPLRPCNYANSDGRCIKVMVDGSLEKSIPDSGDERGANRSPDSFIPTEDTKQPNLSQQPPDMFEDETFDDEKENVLVPCVQLRHNIGKERRKPDFKCANARKPYRRVIRNMPKYRRDSILNLIESQQNGTSGQTLSDQRQKSGLVKQLEGAKDCPTYRPRHKRSRLTSKQELSGSSLSRSLFV